MVDGHGPGRRPCNLLAGIDDRPHRRGLEIEPDRVGRQEGIEGATICDINRDRPPGRGRGDPVQRIGKCRHAFEAHRTVGRHAGNHQAARALQAHDRFGRAARHAAALDRPARQRDGRVAAHGAVALVVHEQHSEIGLGMVGLDQQGAVHAVMSARLQHQPAPQMIKALFRLAPLVEQCPAGESRPAVDDDARGLATRMHLDGRQDHPLSPSACPPNAWPRPAPIRSFIISIEPSV